jgi:hypothetical protein
MTVNLKIEHDGSDHVVEVHRVQGESDQILATLGKNESTTVSL